jgi:cell fate (sporulation/competence/biofilm development) regulator YlbF (YheA/YmcA/DUF963 family)
MNVYEQAHSLAAAVKESEEFKQYDEYKKKIDANPQLSETVKDFMNKQFEVQASQMMGNAPDEEAFQKLQQLSAILMQDPDAAAYLQNYMRFSIMMADVYKIISDVADLGFGPQGGTCGNE